MGGGEVGEYGGRDVIPLNKGKACDGAPRTPHKGCIDTLLWRCEVVNQWIGSG